MSIYTEQIFSIEQAQVLEKLSHEVNIKNAQFLEIGSWTGDTAIIFGHILKPFNGKLFCVDWWKGSIGTELFKDYDDDVFNFFWKRIVDEELDDVIIPVRGKSADVLQQFKENSFDLVFVDADHRYDFVNLDIKYSKNLVKKNGILCGHDCEGYIDDFSEEFLNNGLDSDMQETIHCGVVKAVGENFNEYDINHNVWHVRKDLKNEWTKTNLNWDSALQKTRTSIGYFGINKSNKFFRVKKEIFSIPNHITHIDLSVEENHDDPNITKYYNSEQVNKELEDKLIYNPKFIENYCKKDIYLFLDYFFAIEENQNPELIINETKKYDFKITENPRKVSLENEIEISLLKSKIKNSSKKNKTKILNSNSFQKKFQEFQKQQLASQRIRELEKQLKIVHENGNKRIKELEKNIEDIEEKKSSRIIQLEKYIENLKNSNTFYSENQLKIVQENGNKRIKELEKNIENLEKQHKIVHENGIKRIKELEKNIEDIQEEKSKRIIELEKLLKQ